MNLMTRRSKLVLLLGILIVVLLIPEQQAMGGIFDSVKNFVSGVWKGGKDVFFYALSGFFAIIFDLIHKLFWLLNYYILAPVINLLSGLDPFQRTEENAPIVIIWDLIKNFSYIFLSFSAIFASYRWLFGDDATAKRVIFNIIMVAFLINFSFLFVQETFKIARAIEKGLSGGAGDYIGTIIAASLWQGKDPFQVIVDAIKGSGRAEDSENQILIFMANIGGYIFVIMLDMIIFTILIMTGSLFLARYILVMFYAAISSFAIASLALPLAQKGVLAGFINNIRGAFDRWLQGYFKWLVVIPVFIIMVLIGNFMVNETMKQLGTPSSAMSNQQRSSIVFNQQYLAQAGLGGGLRTGTSTATNPQQSLIATGGTLDINSLIQFLIVLLLLAAWYLVSIKIAVNLSDSVGKLSKAIALGFIAALPGLALRGGKLMARGQIGSLLASRGKNIEERFAGRGQIGNWISQKIGKEIKTTGERMIERRYKNITEGLKLRLSTFENELKDPKLSPQRRAQINKEIQDIVQNYQRVPYVLSQISDSFKRMSPNAFNQLENETLSTLIASAAISLEMRDAFISQINGMSDKDIENIFKNPDRLKVFINLPPEIAKAFANQTRSKLADVNVIDILNNPEVRRIINSLMPDHFLRHAIRTVSKGFSEALANQQKDEIVAALTDFSPKSWLKTEELQNIITGAGFNTGEIVTQAIKVSGDPKSIINTLLKKPKTDPLVRDFISYAQNNQIQIDEIKKQLPSDLAAKLESILI